MGEVARHASRVFETTQQKQRQRCDFSGPRGFKVSFQTKCGCQKLTIPHRIPILELSYSFYGAMQIVLPSTFLHMFKSFAGEVLFA